MEFLLIITLRLVGPAFVLLMGSFLLTLACPRRAAKALSKVLKLVRVGRR